MGVCNVFALNHLSHLICWLLLYPPAAAMHHKQHAAGPYDIAGDPKRSLHLLCIH